MSSTLDNPILDRVFDILEELGWNYFVPANAGFDGLLVIAEVQNAYWLCMIDTLEDDHQVLVHVLLPVRAPSERMAAVREYVSRASALMAMGSLVLDHDARLVRVKDGLDAVDEHLGVERFREFVERAVVGADQHLPGLIGVMFQAMEARAALDLVVRFPVDVVMDHANNMLRGC